MRDQTADAIRHALTLTVGAWHPHRPDHAPGWVLDPFRLDPAAGEIRYALRPEAPRLRAEPVRHFVVRITVEETTPCRSSSPSSPPPSPSPP